MDELFRDAIEARGILFNERKKQRLIDKQSSSENIELHKIAEKGPDGKLSKVDAEHFIKNLERCTKTLIAIGNEPAHQEYDNKQFVGEGPETQKASKEESDRIVRGVLNNHSKEERQDADKVPNPSTKPTAAAQLGGGRDGFGRGG